MERKQISGGAGKPLELYIHIPFCLKKCAYCDFLSAPAGEKEREEYVQILCEEIRTNAGKVEEYQVSSIFFGGGTPSLLTGDQFRMILDTVRDQYHISADAEISMEMNPGTVTDEKLKAYKDAGVNRLSIGLQSVHDEELRMLGRIHTYEEFLEAYRSARMCGFDNINIDLISAIPGQTAESWTETLRTVAALEPEHISAYSLIIEPGTLFYDRYGEDAGREERAESGCEKRKGANLPWPALPTEEEEREMYHQTEQILVGAGYQRYEISNYAKPGYRCRHNCGYWRRVPYLGFGVGAATFFEGERYSNPEKMTEYRDNFEEKFSGEKLSLEDEMEEFMFLGLRMTEGISKTEFEEAFGTGIEAVYGKPIRKLKGMHLIEEHEDRIALTEQGIDVSNTVFVEFMF